MPYHTCHSAFRETAILQVKIDANVHSGGMPRGLSIKVGNMVPACCTHNSGSIADTLFSKRLSFERGGLQPDQAEERE